MYSKLGNWRSVYGLGIQPSDSGDAVEREKREMDGYKTTTTVPQSHEFLCQTLAAQRMQWRIVWGYKHMCVVSCIPKSVCRRVHLSKRHMPDTRMLCCVCREQSKLALKLSTIATSCMQLSNRKGKIESSQGLAAFFFVGVLSRNTTTNRGGDGQNVLCSVCLCSLPLCPTIVLTWSQYIPHAI